MTDSDLDITNEFVQLSSESTKPPGTFEWGGVIVNRSKFQVTAGVTLELINVDNAVYHTTSEHLVVISGRNNGTF